MASLHGRRNVGSKTRRLEHSDLQRNYHGGEPSLSSPSTKLSHSASYRTSREEHRDTGSLLREQLVERDQHVARLQDTLRREREKCARLQSRCNQQETELKRREQHSNRLKERLSHLSDRQREKGPSIELLNFLPGGQKKKDLTARPSRPDQREEAALQKMLERREAELREAMKLRHCLTTLLHALRVDMEQALKETVDDQDEVLTDGQQLVETELALGDHLTGGVVQAWRKVQRRLEDRAVGGHNAFGTDEDKLLAQLEAELEESRQLIKQQQQLLQDSVVSPIPSDLADSYFLEEWERLQARWAELNEQRQNFTRERQSFTEAAIRLGQERRDFEQQKALLLKQQYLCESPFGKGEHGNRRESMSLNFSGVAHLIPPGCSPSTPSTTESGITGVVGSCQSRARARARVQTPSTPELYSVLKLQYSHSVDDLQLEIWDGGVGRLLRKPHPPCMDWSF